MKRYKLGEIAEIYNGSTPASTKPEYYGGDIIWITPKDLSDQGTKYIDHGERSITQAGYDSCSTTLIPAGNILMSSRAPIGLLAINKVDCCTNQGFKNIVVNKKIADTEYIYYFLMQNIESIKRLSGGTTFQEVSKKTLEQCEFEIPDLSEQQRIAKILSTIDAKIELNKKISRELEAMAKELYDYWFVQFDFPNEQGKPYKSSGGKMVWNETLKREIPEGWEVKNIQEVCEIIDCLHSKKPDMVYESENCYLLQLDNLVDMGLLNLSSKYYVSASDYTVWTSKIEVKCGDLVITNAGRVGDIARIPKGIVCGIGRNMTAIRAVSIDPIFMYYFFASSDMKAQIKLNTDKGSLFGSLNVRGIKLLIIAIPPEDSKIMKRFIDVVCPIREDLEMIALQSQKLSKLRDYLLPLLMNGQVRVSQS